jgi:CelD/BcsL family acetyltransferase involved in cellulose biosynthesis
MSGYKRWRVPRRILVSVRVTLMLSVEMIVEVSAMHEPAPEWDSLAIANAMPLMSPGWILPWWQHLAPADAKPRVVAVRDGSELIGLAPFYVDRYSHPGRIDYRLCGSWRSRLGPLATPGREWEVAAAVAQALGRATPRPDLIALEAGPVASPWLAALRDGWPSAIRPSARLYETRQCPVVSLRQDSFDSWFAARSAKFRSSMRRLHRRFEEVGGLYRMSTLKTLSSDIATLLRLHLARWESRGGSSLAAFGDRLPAMLEQAGGMLLEEGRFRLWVAEVAGEPISADLYLATGGEVLGVTGGWSESWKKLSPPLLATLRTIEDAFERGDRRVDLGLGDESHKVRFADGSDPIAWGILMPVGCRLPLTAIRTAPMLARHSARATARRVLSPEQADRMRAARQRLRS